MVWMRVRNVLDRTFLLTTWMQGRAVLYNVNATLIKMPMMMPNSSDSMRQDSSVTINGTISIRLHRHISPISLTSTKLNMAQMMTAANVLFGMYWKEPVRKPSESNTMQPVKMPPSVVRTPLALLMAVRVNEPVVGID